MVANYTVTDDHGATEHRTLTITVTGTNDAPVAVADTNSRRRRQPTITGTVATNDSDVDDGATLSYALNAPVGGLTLNTDGSYSFDAGNAAYQHLARARPTDVVANYTVTDEHGATEHRDPHHHPHRHQRCAGGGGRHQQPATEDGARSPARWRPTTATSTTARTLSYAPQCRRSAG